MSEQGMIRHFQKRPVEIDAMQFTGENQQAIEKAFFPDGNKEETVFFWDSDKKQAVLRIWSPEGVMTAQPTDWIVRHANGAFFPYESDMFAATYQAID